MRRGAVSIIGLMVCLVGGCFTTPAVPGGSSFRKHFENLDYVNTSDLLQIEVRLIETRFGDSYIDKEMWDTSLDEGAVSFKQRGPLARNGLRVGRVAGAIPPRLQEMMTLERCCVNPRLLITAAGKPSTIHLGPVRPECRFEVEQQGQINLVELTQAQFGLLVEPGLTEDGNVRLTFTPKIEYGDSVSNFLPTRDGSGWILERKRSCQLYADMSWEVTLNPSTFLVIGGSRNAPESLGYQAFADTQSTPPMQRLLVLRSGRANDSGIDAEIAPGPAGTAQTTAVPLAQQAAEPLARASAY